MGTKVAQDPIAISGPPFRNDGAKMGRSDFARSPGRWLKRQRPSRLQKLDANSTKTNSDGCGTQRWPFPWHPLPQNRRPKNQAEMQVLQKKHFSSQAWQPFCQLSTSQALSWSMELSWQKPRPSHL